MSEEKEGKDPERGEVDEAPEGKEESSPSGPKFTESPDPLSGIRKATGEAWQGTEGKTVSMRVYIGSIVGVIILMMLARCGG